MIMVGNDSSIRVLVVDDSEIGREVIRQDLMGDGFEIDVAGSGREAIEKVRQLHPEVVLLDIEMPDMNGLETCARLKADPDTALSQVLFLTGHDADDDLVVEALSVGGNDFVSKSYSKPILRARVRNQSSIYRAKAQLRQMVMTDELTGVFNRRFLFDALRRNVKRLTRRTGGDVACMILDVDYFKSINDRFGHLEGDRVLKQVANTVRTVVRESDLVARFGGEEFVVVMLDTGAEGATVVAEKLRARVESECVPVTVSIGVTATRIEPRVPGGEPPNVDKLIHEVLRTADEAVYVSKREGRNRVTYANIEEVVSDAEGADKRTKPRFVLQTEVDLIDDHGRATRHQTADLSMGGLALENVPSLQTGDLVKLQVELGERSCRIEGRVKWRGEIPGVGVRAGVKFENLPFDTETALRHFIHVTVDAGEKAR